MTAQADVAAIYARRFDDEEQRREMWEVLCTGFYGVRVTRCIPRSGSSP